MCRQYSLYSLQFFLVVCSYSMIIQDDDGLFQITWIKKIVRNVLPYSILKGLLLILFVICDVLILREKILRNQISEL